MVQLLLQELETLTSPNTLANNLVRVLIIVILTWLTAKLASWLAVRALASRSLTWHSHIREQRLITLQSLLRGAVKIAVYVAGGIVILFALGIPGGSILTAAALFSAGFGFAARPIISDYMAGIILIFEDMFAVGDKVEMLDIIGQVEKVDLRTTYLRSNTGELYTIPNGDVRVVRNLSRGTFSVATIKVTVATQDLSRTLDVLRDVADSAQAKLPDLIERPEFLSEEGAISAQVELTLLARAVYGRGARVRTRLMALVTDALRNADVHVIGEGG